MSTSGENRDRPEGPEGREPEVDFEAAWGEIVAHWDEEALSDRDVSVEEQPPAPDTSRETPPDTPPGPVDETYPAEVVEVEPLDEWDDEPLQVHRSLDDPELLRPEPVNVWVPEEGPDPVDNATYNPPTPPLPRSTPERWIAWITLLGVPVLVLLFTLLNYRPIEMVSWALAAAWFGAFAWLVLHMNDAPRDPWDDGSRV